MFSEVYTTEDLSNQVFDSLQQILGSEAPRPLILMGDKTPKINTGEGFKTGQIYYLKEGVFLGALPGQKPLDFSWEKKFRKWQGEAPGHPLKKAMGKGFSTVIDSTVGFGNDTCILLALGFNVLGFERNPLIFLAQNLSQIREEFMLKRLSLNFGSPVQNPDNFPIYFDPMFDDGKKRKAKPTKEMEVFHFILGGDDDAASEGERLRSISSRLVIKRSPRDEPLLPNVNSQWESKALRLDLYL